MYRFSKEPLIVILGCTCTGKTKFSVHVSNYLKEKDFELESESNKNIDIVSGKAMFIYHALKTYEIWFGEHNSSYDEIKRFLDKWKKLSF